MERFETQTNKHQFVYMAKLKLDYLWLDGYAPVANIRGKTLVKDGDPDTWSLDDCPMWGFDGSSTLQAEEAALTAS